MKERLYEAIQAFLPSAHAPFESYIADYVCRGVQFVYVLCRLNRQYLSILYLLLRIII